jgi:hypothetical protein
MEAGRAFKPHSFFTFPHDLMRVSAELFQQPRHHLQSGFPEGNQCCESERYTAVKETATLFMDSVSNACVAPPISFSSVRTIACDAAVHWAEAILANNLRHNHSTYPDNLDGGTDPSSANAVVPSASNLCARHLFPDSYAPS